MSHDRKPGRMRVVGGAPGTPERRLSDVASGAASPVSAELMVPNVASKGSGRLHAMLFIAGCALGGAALPLARTL